MGNLLRTRPATTSAMLRVFDDQSTLSHALRFEACLARAEAEAGLLTDKQAEAVERACASDDLDPAALADEAAHAGTLAIALVARLRQAAGEEHARAVHFGATSQDLADTVLAIQTKEATALLKADAARLTSALADLAERHAGTPALGHTLLQDALPITFGLRVANWLAAIDECWKRVERASSDGAKLQFGGAVGTRAGLDGKGAQVADRLAEALGLSPAAPWHSRRDGIANLACALAILVGAVGKVARDISLLSQTSNAELREPAVPGRGGSSAMPHKRNPTGCQLCLSAAIRAPGLAATIISALPQELERGLGGWQAEAPVLAELFELAAGNVQAMADVIEGLEVDEGAIARNLARAHVGDDVGEAVQIVSDLLARRRKQG